MVKPENALSERLEPTPASLRTMSAGRLMAALISGAALVLCGCGKKEQAPAVTPAPAAESQPAPQAQGPATAAATLPAPTLVQADGQVDMAELQRCVIRWVVGHRRHPASFEEFAATAGVTIPPPPPGKKYSLTQGIHVTLINQ